MKGVLVEPLTGTVPLRCGSMTTPCRHAEGGFDESFPGLSIRSPDYHASSVFLRLPVSNYLPILPLGRYRLTVLTQGTYWPPRRPGSTPQTSPLPPVLAVSEPAEIEVTPSDAAWAHATYFRLVHGLEAMRAELRTNRADFEERAHAFETGRLQLDRLDGPDARHALDTLDLHPDLREALKEIVVQSRIAPEGCEWFRRYVQAPETAVTPRIVSQWSTVCTRAHSGVAPSKDIAFPLSEEADWTLAQSVARSTQWRELMLNEIGLHLAYSLAGKSPEAFRETAITFANMVQPPYPPFVEGVVVKGPGGRPRGVFPSHPDPNRVLMPDYAQLLMKQFAARQKDLPHDIRTAVLSAMLPVCPPAEAIAFMESALNDSRVYGSQGTRELLNLYMKFEPERARVWMEANSP
ncbi:MAG: hypothetical protein KIT83_16760 [Bryobacterales bacterium]|nr:hypothetical protein [Bryobacterales bacterium]